ncbi:hypothetical protein QBC44DRAFT_404620 [Cladorrhinum sp. PSN332]|nr:hypothetical protein QBC44DRAFT_404620 [Cladorrhinum sp. PSN332]
MDWGSPTLSTVANTLLVSPECWQQAKFSASVKYALREGFLDPNTSWTEDDLVHPPPPDGHHGGCVIPSPEPDEDFEGAWFRRNTPLHRAVWVNDFDTVEQLLASGADIDKHNSIGLTVLQEAVRSQKSNAAELLLKRGADPNTLTVAATAEWWERAWDTGDLSRKEAHERGNQVALHLALLNGDTVTARFLIENGADLTPVCLGDWSFLDLALLAEDHEAFALFWSQGVRLSTQSHGADTAASSFDREEHARQLLAFATSGRIQPPGDLHLVYRYVLSKVEAKTFAKMDQDPSASAMDQMIQSFFDILYVTARVRPSTPVVNFCERCSEFYGQVRHRKLPDQGTRFILHQKRQDLEHSASQGCPLCVLVVDALDEDEPRVRREEESNEDFYTPPDAEPEPDGKDPLVYLKVTKGSEIMTRQYYLGIQCQKWRNRLPISRVEEGTFPFFNPEGEDRMGLGTASKRTFQTAKAWLQNCKVSPAHAGCQKTSNLVGDSDSLPSRLIYVPPSEEGDADPFLVNGSDAQGQPYVALSYCWGLTPTIRTIKSNIPQHFRSIGRINSLPATIRDAILATRFLGISYIWIDALCIIQDDPQDWSSEAKRMHLVYLNAALTISSLTSKASTDPFFLPSKVRSVYPVPIPFWEPKCERPAWAQDTKASFHTHAILRDFLHQSTTFISLTGPINTRGWTLQEQLLSTRTLLFGKGILHWECLCQYTTEADPTSSLPRIRHLAGEVPQTEAKCRIRGMGDDKQVSWTKGVFEVWQDLVGELTRREFTRFEDRLPAFMGVARFMVDNGVLSAAGDSNKEEMEFVGGIWKGQRLLESLCWNVTAPVKEVPEPEDFMQPSWTWVGVKGEIGFQYMDRSGREDREPVPKVMVGNVGAEIDPVTFRVSGSITLRGRLYRKKVLEGLFKSEWGGSSKYSFDYEGLSNRDDLYILELLAFPPGPLPTGFGYPIYPAGRPPERVFLILQRLGRVEADGGGSGRQKGEYRRVGVGSYAWEWFRGIKDLDDPLLEAGCAVEEGCVVSIF